MGENILDNIGGTNMNSLLNVLGTSQNENLNEPILIKQSPYFDSDEIIAYLKNKQNQFTVISLNCESLNAKIDELNIFLDNLSSHGCLPSAICLQETWLQNDSDLSL